jgi:predicted nucleic acid-binding protein
LRYVLDCSVVLKWFIAEPLSDVATRLLHEFVADQAAFLAPDAIYAELGYILRKHVLRGHFTAERGHAFMDQFVALGIPTVPIASLSSEAARLTTAHMASFYDSLYVALAIREDLKVLTADEAMMRAFARLDRAAFLADLEQG